jgi:formate dehydrogenase major subunit
VRALYLFEASPLHAFEAGGEEREWLRRVDTVILQRSRPSPLDELAHVILPGRTFVEKDGTVTNMEGRVQRIRAAIDAAAVRDDWKILQGVARALGADWGYGGPEAIFADLSRAVPAYRADRIGERALWEGRSRARRWWSRPWSRRRS